MFFYGAAKQAVQPLVYNTKRTMSVCLSVCLSVRTVQWCRLLTCGAKTAGGRGLKFAHRPEDVWRDGSVDKRCRCGGRWARGTCWKCADFPIASTWANWRAKIVENAKTGRHGRRPEATSLVLSGRFERGKHGFVEN